MTMQDIIDHSKIDGGIAELVYSLNKIPGVSTIGSCQGHVEKFYRLHVVEDGESKPSEYVPADSGQVFLRGGFVTFTLDESVKEAIRFRDELDKYAHDNTHIEFGIYNPLSSDKLKPASEPRLEGEVYLFNMVCNDLLQKHEKVPDTDPNAAIKNIWQLPYQEALQRYVDWVKALLDLTFIVDKYKK